MVHQGGDGFSENVKIFDPLQILQEIFAPPPLGSEENFDPPPPNLVQANFSVILYHKFYYKFLCREEGEFPLFL